ncbi:hypothetical protein ACHAW6_000724 [Cyclotella cf. meneghiniana]
MAVHLPDDPRHWAQPCTGGTGSSHEIPPSNHRIHQPHQQQTQDPHERS